MVRTAVAAAGGSVFDSVAQKTTTSRCRSSEKWLGGGRPRRSEDGPEPALRTPGRKGTARSSLFTDGSFGGS